MADNDERNDNGVSRRALLLAGTVAAATGAAAIASAPDRALAWVTPTIRNAVGVPAASSSDVTWRTLDIDVLVGERLSETVRSITLVLSYLDDNSLAANVGVYGDSQTLPGNILAVWHPTLDPDSPQYGFTGPDGTVTFYSRADPASPEIRNMFFSASLEDEGHILALGNRSWFPSNLPDWINGPWPM